MFDEFTNAPKHKSGDEPKKHTFATVVHEVGHAVCGLELKVKKAAVRIQMNEHYRESEFGNRGEIHVHGFNIIDKQDFPVMSLEDTKMAVATIAFAGLVSELLFIPQFENANNDALYAAINSSLVKWSPEDKRQVDLAGSRKREAFDNAVAILRRCLSDLAKYVDFIWTDFLKDERDSIKYTLVSRAYKIPSKEAV